MKRIFLVILLGFSVVMSGKGVAFSNNLCDKKYNDCRDDVNTTFGKVNDSNINERLGALEQCGEKYTDCKEREKIPSNRIFNYIFGGIIITASVAVTILSCILC